MRKIPAARVEWPRGETFNQFTHHIVDRHDRLFGAFGFIDGLKLPVEESSDQDIENAMYNGWLHDHYISNILAFAPDGAYSILFFACLKPSLIWVPQGLLLLAASTHLEAGMTQK